MRTALAAGVPLCAAALVLGTGVADAEIYKHPGSTTPVPHQKYIHVVSEADSPVQPTYIKSKDGLYIAAAIRRPKGDGPFPAMIIFHGAPGGRGMEQLVGWSRGDHGGPVWERFLQEGYVVVVADYRGGNMNLTSTPSTTGMVTAIDDGLAVIDHVKTLSYVDSERISLYGVSLGGNLVAHLVSKVQVHSAILGAPATIWFLGMTFPPGGPGTGADRFKDARPDPEIARRNIEPIRTPILILVGTADGLLPVATMLHDALAAQGKAVRMDVYEHGYHDFCLGPQGQKRPDLKQGEVLLDSALDALEKSVLFAAGKLRPLASPPQKGAASLSGKEAAAAPPSGTPAAGQATSPQPEPRAWTTEEDHRNMMEQLGIKALRPGPSGKEGAPNAANYDEALANPFPALPDVLTLKNGRKVDRPEVWWAQRRPEIVEDFEREVYGRIPPTVPNVTWSVAAEESGTISGRAVKGRHLVGKVDNSAYPALSVEIQLMLVTPATATGPVPVMIMFRGGSLQQAIGNAPPSAGPGRFGGPPPPGSDPPATEQLIAAGWGFAFLDPRSIQADNGAGLTRGIIGLVNKGQFRKPDDWGSLRAWSWGAARALDYFETDPAVDAKRVGIEGVSRYGKAALVTMAFEPRFAVVLVGSSGEGGAKLHRRNFGEAVENLTGSGEYHWMAGNFLKYGAAEATFGSRNAGDIPVDAHMLIALCAPRATFISYGIPEKGDAKWLDQQGSFMAAVAAGPVFRLLGAKDLGTSDDYMKEKMPPVNVGLLEGRLAWRQHDGGHTDGPNWKYFIPWADRQLGREPLTPTR